MRRLFLCFIVFFAFVSDCRSEDMEEIFANTTYIIGNEYSSQRVLLVDGEYEEPYLLYVYYEDKFVCGDFNNDGLKDAAVIIAESGGGSGYYYMLAFLINNGTQFIHKASYDLGDSVIINSLEEQQGTAVVDMFVHRPGDCRADPTRRVRNVYEYSGTQVWGEGNS